MAKKKVNFSNKKFDRANLEEDSFNSNRIKGIEKEKKPNKVLNIVLTIAIVALAVGALLLIAKKTKPDFLKKDKSILSEHSDKKQLPELETQNAQLLRGKNYYFKGYTNDALNEFKEVIESDANNRDKAEALTFMGIIYDDRHELNKAITTYKRALKYDDKNPLIYRNLAIAYNKNGNYEKAYNSAKYALNINPHDIQNRILAGNILYNQGKLQEAVEEYKDALEKDEKNAQILYNLGMTLSKQGDQIAAVNYFKKAAEYDKNGKIAHLSYNKLGTIYSNAKNYKLAEKYLTTAVKMRPEDTTSRYNLAVVYLKNKKNQEALAELELVQIQESENLELLEKLGEAYLSLNNYDKGLEVYQKILEKQSNNVSILARIAELYYQKKDLQNAIRTYRKIIETTPGTENARVALINLANCYDEAQMFDAAIESYKKAIHLDPKDSSVYYNLGIAYKHLGKPELAVESWRKGAELNPDDISSLVAIGNYYYEQRFYNEAEDVYVKILRRRADLPEANFRLAGIYFQKSHFALAQKYYKKVLEFDNKSEYAKLTYINLAMIHLQSETENEAQYAEAQTYIQKALLMHPNDTDALYTQGLLYLKQGYHRQAIDTFYQVISTTQKSSLLAKSYNNIGKCYYAKRDYQKALQAFTKGLEEDPQNEEMRLNRRAALQYYEEGLEE